MEQARCWMWMRSRKHGSGQLFPRLVVNGAAAGSPYDHRSWEEKAFAEDAAAAHLGGCVWPPRSYSCTFCRREFRSAQALGGHMNIHRRDRARLQHSPPPPPPPPPQGLAGDTSLAVPSAGDVQSPATPLVIQPQVISRIVFGAAANPNPNSGAPASLLIPARACTLLPPSFSPPTRRIIIVPESKLGGKDLGSKESDRGAHDEAEIIARSSKRRKLNCALTPVYSIRADEDEVDLELRLGDAPKMK